MPYARIFLVAMADSKNKNASRMRRTEFLRGHFAQLRFRIVQVEDVDRIQPQILPAAFQLIRQIIRRHAMAARGNILHSKNSALQKLLRKINIRIGGHFSVRRQKSCLGADHDFIATVTFVEKLAQRGAHRALAALKPVIDGGVHHVDTALHRRHDCIHVGAVCGIVGVTQISPDADRRKHQPAADFAKVSGGRAPLKPRRVTQSPLRRGRAGLAFAIEWRS